MDVGVARNHLNLISSSNCRPTVLGSSPTVLTVCPLAAFINQGITGQSDITDTVKAAIPKSSLIKLWRERLPPHTPPCLQTL